MPPKASTGRRAPFGAVRHQQLVKLAACLALGSLSACVSMNPKPVQADVSIWPEIRSDFKREALRARLQEYAITFAAEVNLAATSIERRSVDPSVRRNALVWRLGAIPEMRKACFRTEPVGALIDAWTLARQMEQLFTAGAAAEAFGPFQGEAVELSRRLLVQMQDITDSIAVSPQARTALESKIIDPWLAAHPLQDIAFVRESPIARFADQAGARGDVFQSVGTMEEVLFGLSQQARIYLADLPRQLRGEIDLLRTDMLSAGSLTAMEGDLGRTAASAGRVSATVEDIPDLLRGEVTIVLDDVSRQRVLITDAISAEREEIIRALASERQLVLTDVESQRLATLEWGTNERREAMKDVHKEVTAAIAALRVEREAIADDARRIVDAVLLRLGLFVLAALVLAPLVAHVYARVWPRR